MVGNGYKVVSVSPTSVTLERTEVGKNKGKRYKITAEE